MKDSNPAVSIIICVYNGRKFLDDFIGLIRNQTFTDYEMVFVVDSRSDDGSLEYIEDYCEREPKASVVIQRDCTKLGGAKNLGIDNAKGRYLWFPDVDDIPSNDFLKRMVDAKESTSSDVALCNFQYTDDRDWKAPYEGEVLTMSGKTALHARSLNIIPVTSWAMLYDREYILNSGIRFEEGMAEDIAFTYLALNGSRTVCYITAPLYGYYQNAESFCKKNRDERGKRELESYMFLSGELPKDNRYLQDKLCSIGTRSLVHMTRKGFRTEIKKDLVKTYVKENMAFIGSAEYRFVRLFPSIYHIGVNWYINRFYCRTGKIYTGKGKMKTLRKIVDSSKDSGSAQY